jgi:hypothetical protein
MARKIRFHSPYAPIPLAEILKKEMDRDWTAEEEKSGRVVGSGTEEKFSLRVERKNLRNDFSLRFEGDLIADRGGTLIEGSLGRSRSTSRFMFGWLVFVGLFFVTGLLMLIRPDTAWTDKLGFVVVPAFMLAFGIGLLKLGGGNAQRDEDRILAFLRDKAQARAE